MNACRAELPNEVVQASEAIWGKDGKLDYRIRPARFCGMGYHISALL
jgi:hypothetical protein